MKHISSLAALALITLTSGQALARDGEYYEGVSQQPATVGEIDRNYTGSISASANSHTMKQKINSGDYYEGIQRPN